MTENAARALSGRQIARAAGIVMLAFVATGVLGIVRQAAISAAFGAGARLDAFVAAQRVPETLFVLVAGGALGSAFIPVFTGFLAHDQHAAAQQLAIGVITLLIAASGLLALVAFIFAGPITRWFLLPDAASSTQSLAVELMRIMLITVVIFAVSGLMMGILNAHQRFIAPALAPSLYNIGIIFGAVALTSAWGVHGLAWGTVLGSLLHMAVQIPSLLTVQFRYRPTLNLHIPGEREVLLLMGPRVLGLGIVQVNFWVNTALASGMAEGSVSALSVSFVLLMTVLGVVGRSVGTAVFPTLSTLTAQHETETFRRTLSGALDSVLFLSIPAGIGLAAASLPIVTVLFERGEWTSTDSAGTAWALALFSIGLVGHAVLEILVRAFYALHDTWTPVKVGTATMLLNIALSLLLIALYPADARFAYGPFGALAFSMSVATALESATLWIILQRRIGGMDDRRLLTSAARTLIASLFMAAAVGGFLIALPDLHALFQTIGAVSIGGLVFVVAAYLLHIDQIALLTRIRLRIPARLRR